MVPFPKYIRLGGHVIKIVRQKNLIATQDAFGTWDDGALQITIDADLARGLAWETLFHEIMEALNAVTDAGLEHSTIQTFGLLLHQVFDSFLEKGQEDA